MAKRRGKRKRSSGVSEFIYLCIAMGVLLIGTGGFSLFNQNKGAFHLDVWHMGMWSDLIGIAPFVLISLGVYLWLRLSKHRSSYWASKVLGIHSVEDIYALSPGQFEEFVAYLFTKDGYDARVTGQTGDEGIDIEVRRRGAGQSPRIVVQCKRYRGSVGQPVVREFFGSFANEAAEGFLVTTGTFTQPARDWVASRPLRLVDGAELMRWTEQTAQRLNHHHEPAPDFLQQRV